MDEKVSPDFAEQEFNRFVDLCYLDCDEKDMNAEELEEFSKVKRRITKAIQRGTLVINDDGNPVYTPLLNNEEGKSIIFSLPGGADLMASDKVKKVEGIKGLFSIMQSLTKTPTGYFAKMYKNPDLNVCIAITNLFLVE